jgi:protoporphyrin/coproporphyrin ferrochelatase
LDKKAILLMAYGSPEKEEDVEPYYTHIRGGRKPTPEEIRNLKDRYSKIRGPSPLLKITKSTASRLEARLRSRGNDVRVYAGMKHWHPHIAEEFENIAREGTIDLLSIALAPHYSKMSIGSYQDTVRQANKDHGDKIKLQFVDNWCFNPTFMDKWVQRIQGAQRKHFGSTCPFLLFSAHSLPERILTWNDPYRQQLLETAEKIASRLGIGREGFGFAFQSAGHTSEPWLGPDILDRLSELSNQGIKNVLVAPIGFVSDHLEILFDLDVEAKELAKKLGMKIERTESFNDSDDFIDVLESVVRESGFIESLQEARLRSK